VANADPFDVAATDCVGKRVQRIADQSENVLDPDLLKHADQNIRNRLRHRRLLLLQSFDRRQRQQRSLLWRTTVAAIVPSIP
jgi:hypothetical protein